MKWSVIFIIRCYQRLISPFITPACRYEPSCSQYMIDAMRHKGLIKGGWLGMCRICRCHPWGGSGHDPVEKED